MDNKIKQMPEYMLCKVSFKLYWLLSPIISDFFSFYHLIQLFYLYNYNVSGMLTRNKPVFQSNRKRERGEKNIKKNLRKQQDWNKYWTKREMARKTKKKDIIRKKMRKSESPLKYSRIFSTNCKGAIWRKFLRIFTYIFYIYCVLIFKKPEIFSALLEI